MDTKTLSQKVKSERFTMSDMNRYLSALTLETKKLHDDAYLLFRDSADTLSENFQVAALVVGVFQNRAIEWRMKHDG